MSTARPGQDSLCDYDDVPGIPYEYKGTIYNGLVAFKGDRICPACVSRRMDTEGVDILVVDDRPSVPPYVYNTVRDRDRAPIWIPAELRGIDGRDLPRIRRRH